MNPKSIFSFFFSVAALGAFAQDKNATIFTVGGTPVSVNEFEYVYTKNNLNNQANYSEKSLTDYLNLYENFRLKVKEAEAQKLDTISSLKNELEGYRKQLAKSFLTDREITDQLIKEAYDRSLHEVNCSHILVKCDENANPADTLAAYKKAMEIHKRLLRGDDFGKVAMELSDDPSAKQNKGMIGYFTVFMTVYPFETAAYNMKEGETSMPVRTQFGYHLVKLNAKRPAQGEIHVAHILLKFPQDATDAQKAEIKTKIDSIHTQIVKGNLSWDDAVLAFSGDRTNRLKKGELPSFSTGKMVPEFETAAYALSKDGEISNPIKTNYGWHIIQRLDKKSIPAFNEIKSDIKKKVERDSRSSVAKTKLIDRIKKENNFSVNEYNKNSFFTALDSTIVKGGIHADSIKFDGTKPIFNLANKNYPASDFAQYLEKMVRRRSDKSKDALAHEYLDSYVSQKCLDFEESQLETKKPEFKNLLKEYRDGILLFELTDRMVWGKAVKDTLGLQTFHEANKSKYMWKERANAEVYNCSNEKICKEAYKLAEKGKSFDEIQRKVNAKDAKNKVSVIAGKYEKGAYDLIDKLDGKVGLNPIKMNNDSTYQFIFIRSILPAEPKSLKDAKGYAVSDYQEFLEKKWLADLREKYPIVLNDSVFKSLIKK